MAEALNVAFEHLSRGRWSEAERVAGAILAVAADEAGAWWIAGVAAAETTRGEIAAARFLRALTLAPGTAGYWRASAGALTITGDTGGAQTRIRRGARLEPDSTEAWIQAADVGLGREAGRRAVSLTPNDSRAWIALSRSDVGDPEAALTAARRAAALSPRDRTAVARLAVAAVTAGLEREGEALLRRLLAARPDQPDVVADLGSLLARSGRMDEAEAVFATAPGTPDVWSARAAARRLAGRFEEAVADCDRVLSVRTRDRGVVWNRALSLLSLGRWREAWPGFEARVAPSRGLPRPTSPDDLAGRVVILTTEQGLGDTLHFIRYAPLFAARGARVIVEVQPELLPLYPEIPGAARVVSRGEPVPEADMECPMMSGPALFGSIPETVPPPLPPHVDPPLASRWRKRLGGGDELKVGLVWAGNPRFQHDRLRSPGFEAIHPLLFVPGVRFFALQFGPGRAPIAGPDSFVDLGPEIRDFADTAAIMSELDLVISSCTAPAHLAGSLGCPLWLWLTIAPDWRWLTERTDTPWYPSARLFRQASVGDWKSVAERTADALGKAIGERNSGRVDHPSNGGKRCPTHRH